MSEELSRYFPCPETITVQKDESGVFNLSISKIITALNAFSSENLSPTKIYIRLIEAEGHEETYGKAVRPIFNEALEIIHEKFPLDTTAIKIIALTQSIKTNNWFRFSVNKEFRKLPEWKLECLRPEEYLAEEGLRYDHIT